MQIFGCAIFIFFIVIPNSRKACEGSLLCNARSLAAPGTTIRNAVTQ